MRAKSLLLQHQVFMNKYQALMLQLETNIHLRNKCNHHKPLKNHQHNTKLNKKQKPKKFITYPN